MLIPSHTSLLYAGNWEGLWYSWCLVPACSSSDADTFALQYYSKGRHSFSHLDDPTMDALYVKQRHELDQDKRRALLWEVIRRVWEQQHTIDISNPTNYTLFQPWIRNGASHTAKWFGLTNVSTYLAWSDPTKKQ